jgi:hypothetical protein
MGQMMWSKQNCFIQNTSGTKLFPNEKGVGGAHAFFL